MKLEEIAEKSAYYSSVNLGIPTFIVVEYFLGNIKGSFKDNFYRLKYELDVNREIYQILDDIQQNI